MGLKDQDWRKLGKNLAFALLVAAFGTMLILTPPVWQLREGPIEIVRWPKTGAQIFVIGPKSHQWTPIHNVSQHAINAIMVSEDARFYEHGGLDWREIRRSIAFNMDQKRYARGASTITQQVVKMAFLGREKSLFRKFREALGAVMLEWFLDKDRILEWYINLVDFGDGVFGIQAASKHYFQTTPELLTIQDGAHLALVIPSPNNWSKGLRQKSLTEFGQKRYAKIIEEMFNLGYITPALRQSALATGDFGRPVQAYEPSKDDPDDKIDLYPEIHEAPPANAIHLGKKPAKGHGGKKPPHP